MYININVLFYQDSEIIEQIDRDVMRTHPDLHFFSGDSSFAKSNQVNFYQLNDTGLGIKLGCLSVNLSCFRKH